MNYENINLNSYEYTKLSNEEKLEVVRSKIKSILNEEGKHKLTIYYKGNKYKINGSKFGILRDLTSRERSLEKRINDKKIQDELNSQINFDDMFFPAGKLSHEDNEKMIKMLNERFARKSSIDSLNEEINANIDNSQNDIIKSGDEEKTNSLISNYKEMVLDSDYYNSLSVEDKIKEINKEKKSHNDLIKEKIYTNDDDNKEYIDFLDKLLLELDKEKISNEVIDQKDEVNSNNEEKTNALIDNYRGIVLDSDYYKHLSVEDKIKEINKEKKSHNDLINEKLYLDDDESKEYIKFLDDTLVKLNVEAISNKVNDKNDVLDNNTEEKKSKNKLFAALMSIPFIAKIKNNIDNKDTLWRRKFNKKKKRVAAFICAGAIALTAFIGFSKKNNNDNVKDNTVPTPITEIDDSKKQDSPVDKVEDKDISLNDTVTIDDNAPIYTNSYDASYNTNGYNALYDGSYDRIIEAVSYELDGKVYTIYRNEDNSYEKVDELIKKGATLTSVLVTRIDLANDVTHEGYYNASNVRVRTR